MEEWIANNWQLTPDIQSKIFYSAITLLIAFILRYIIIRLVIEKVENIKERYYWSRGAKYIISAFAFIIIILIWFTEYESVATVIGLISAGLTIALKDLIVNTAGWIFILVRRPFTIGDRIQIGEHRGDVIDTRVFQFTINEVGNWVDSDQSTGRIIHIPNGKVFTEAQANYNQAFSHIWNEIGVLVTFESNWRKAKSILEKIVKEHAEHLTETAQQKLIETSKKYMILYTKLTPIVYTTVKDSGIMLTMRYLISPHQRRNSEQSIWEDVLDAFQDNTDMDFAYPTRRVYHNYVEGKEDLKPKNQAQ
ncbi:MAG TPA: mechanosensitive ion channel family protein [Cyclobacteriaceae bacterium]